MVLPLPIMDSRNHSGTHKGRQLSILQWNCRSILNKESHLLDYLQGHPDIDVLMLQSPSAKANGLPRIPGFYYPPEMGTEHEKERVMVATYVSMRLTYSPVRTPEASVDSRLITCSVAIPTRGNKRITLVNVYYPAGVRTEKDADWLKQLDSGRDDWVVAGDFNASHRWWDPGAKPSEGEHLANAILDSNLVILNDGSITRIGYTGQRNSAIDLTVASASLCSDASWNTGTDNLQSDHLPIHVVFGDSDPALAEVDTTPKYRYEKANWDLFRSLLISHSVGKELSCSDLNEHLENIRRVILDAADSAIPKGKPPVGSSLRHHTPWWNDDCLNATRAKRQALRKFKKDMTEANREALREATAHCRQTVINAKRDHWEQFCANEIRDPKDGAKVWKKLRTMRGGTRPPERPLIVDGQPTRNAREKAEALAETFARASQAQHLPSDELERRLEEESRFEDPVVDNSAPFNSDLTMGELLRAISSIGSASKASGRDPICYRMVKHFPESFNKHLLELYQNCWAQGKMPEAWKEALVVGIPKGGKPLQLPTSYRPIALTPHLGKIYERMVKNRLEYFLDKHDILPKCQAGFRKGRCCMEHVVTLIENVKKRWTEKSSTVATFFDIKKAFDTVWHGKLLDKLKAIGISGRLHSFVRSFLADRRMAVKVGSAVSQTRTLDMGVPQGSVIAPTLFCIMLYDIEMTGARDLRISLFADDLAVWSDFHGRNRNYGHAWMVRFQDQIDKIQDYMESNGFELSAEKTRLLVFSRSSFFRPMFSLWIGDQQVRHSTEAKFLGVTVHQDLCWDSHIGGLLTKARRAVNLIKILAKQAFCTTQTLVHLTRALVRSRLTYGCEVFFTATKSLWKMLSRVELSALKAALGVSKGAINNLVYQEVGWLPLQDACRLCCATFEARACTVPNCVKEVLGEDFASNETQTRKSLAKDKPRIHARTQPFSAQTKGIWQEAKIDPKSTVQVPLHPYPPWDLESPRIDTGLGGVTKRDNALYLSTLANEKLERSFSQHLRVFTDGSVLETGEVGCAFVIPALDITKRYRLNAHVSIFTAELYAIMMACSFVNELPQPPLAVVILSDSKSSLQALARGGTRDRLGLQAEILSLANQIIRKGSDLTLSWLPSHVGIRGNERADRAAKEAATSGSPVDLGSSLKEVKRKAKRVVRMRWERERQRYCESHGYIFLSGVRSHLPQLSRRKLQILCRIRTASCTYLWKPTRCACGENGSLHHAIGGCQALPQTMTPVWNLKASHKLAVQDYIRPHSELGDLPMRTLVTALVNSGLSHWF